MPDLLAGTTILANDTPVTTEGEQPDNENDVSSTTFIPGTTVCSTTFVAATTGRATIEVYGVLRGDGTNGILLSYELYEGADESGTLITAGDDARAIEVVAAGFGSASMSKLETGLTVGATHFVRTVHRVRGGSTQDVAHRRVMARPAT